ncbi:MAG: extracellular solute-binding protein [Acidaminococcaceae bacterium]
MKKKILALLCLLCLVSGCGTSKSEVVTITVYSELPVEVTESLARDFEKKMTGKVQVKTLALPKQHLAEKLHLLSASDGDLWLGATAEEYFLADQQKALLLYKARGIQAIIPEVRDKKGAWTGLFTTNLGFVSNQKRLRELDVAEPTSWQDLLTTPLQEELVFSDPLWQQGGYRLVTTLWQLWGEQRTLHYAKELRQQAPLEVLDDATAIEEVQEGTRAVAVVPLDLALLAAHNDHNLLVSQAREGTSRKITGVAILKQTGQELRAREFVDYLLSERAKELLYGLDYYAWHLNEDPKDYTWGKQFARGLLIHNDLRWCAVHSNSILAKWQQVP